MEQPVRTPESSPFILLAVFVTGGFFALFWALRGHGDLAPMVSGRVAHSPSEFSAILSDPLLTPPPAGDAAGSHFPVPPPPFSEGIFPCSECHKDLETDPKPRELTMAHEDIHLQHGGEGRWCLDCHDAQNRDQLHLANGTPVPFEESYRLCGQCHGEIYRDWRAGVHGRRTGQWDGAKRYLLCAHCHNPHSPHFAPLRPLPPPVRPEFLGTQEEHR